MKNLILTIVILLVALITEVNAQSFQVIVNEANATESISKQDLSDIFLKKKSKWDDGVAISPVDLNTRSTTRVAFSIEVHEKSIGAIRSYWQQAAFSGDGSAPLERQSDADVISFVQSNPGAVGYISDATEASGVKVLMIN